MIRATWKGLLGRKLRTALTAFAIVLGVAMVTGAYVVTDTMLSAANKLEDASYSGADAAIQTKKAFTSDNGNGGSQVKPMPASLIQTVANVPSVAVAHGEITDTAKLTKKNGDVIDTSGGAPVPRGLRRGQPRGPEAQPVQGQGRRFPDRARRDRDRRRHGRQGELLRRRHHRCERARPCAPVQDHRRRDVWRRRLARQRDRVRVLAEG